MNILKQKIEEISLLHVMLGAEDAQGVGVLFDLCESLCVEVKADSSLKRFVDAGEYLASQRASLSTPDALALLTHFLTNAALFADNSPSAQFPNERGTTSSRSASARITDERLLVEFIETHTQLLEDFESALLDTLAVDPSDTAAVSDATKAAKRYIHNLKGDAGSLYLQDIERACHHVEDKLGNQRAVDMTGELMAFKEWVVTCLKCYTDKIALKESGASFIARFDKAMARFAQSAAPAKGALKVVVAPKSAAAGHSSSLPAEYRVTGDKEIFSEFVAEAEEHLNNIEVQILESDGTYGKDVVDTIFRGVHSLKGGSAYFTLHETTQTSHILENMLSETRDGKRVFDEGLKVLVLEYIDLQKGLLTEARKAVASDSSILTKHASRNFLESLHTYAKGGGEASSAHAQVAQDSSKAVTPSSAVQQTVVPPELRESSSDSKGDKLGVKNFVKVDTERLDKLVDSIGEMVIYSSMLIRQCRELLGDNEEVIDTSSRVEKFGRDLQDIGMSMRLVPIRGLFQKMSRLVWDIGKKLGKDITFTMHGEDTELDRNLIDKLADPLMHMVRNSLDHGVEPPDEREKKGKSRVGNVSLSAFHSGGSIHIRIKDDGRGINPDKIRAKAIEKGIITEHQALSKEEAYQLLFAAGFSTAAQVTDISGRGVGMDVVRRNVESLRGRIHIESEIDKGSTFTIELPLTLAIMDGIDVRVGKDHFIIPSLSIIEFLRPKKGMITYTLDNGETFQFRGKYLPVFRLSVLYGLEAHFSNPEDATIVVVENGGEYVALMVDEILGEYSTVIKSLGALFQEAKGLAGCAIMPDGDVSLILDIRSLIQLARTEYNPHAIPTEMIERETEIVEFPEEDCTRGVQH